MGFKGKVGTPSTTLTQPTSPQHQAYGCFQEKQTQHQVSSGHQQSHPIPLLSPTFPARSSVTVNSQCICMAPVSPPEPFSGGIVDADALKLWRRRAWAGSGLPKPAQTNPVKSLLTQEHGSDPAHVHLQAPKINLLNWYQWGKKWRDYLI